MRRPALSTHMFLDALAQVDPKHHVFNAGPDIAPGRSVIIKATHMLAF